MAARDYDDRYKKFRAAVIARDKGKCQFPGCKRRSKVQVHHIARWVDSYELRFEPSNGICLCRWHHNHIKNHEHLYNDLFIEIVKKNSGKKRRRPTGQ